MSPEKEHLSLLPSSKELEKQESQKWSFEEELSKSFAPLSPEKQNQAKELILSNADNITNKLIFLKKLSNLIRNQPEDHIITSIQTLIEKENLHKREKKDIDEKEPMISVYVKNTIKEDNIQSTTQETETTTQETETTTQETETTTQETETTTQETETTTQETKNTVDLKNQKQEKDIFLKWNINEIGKNVGEIRENMRTMEKNIQEMTERVRATYEALDPKYTTHTEAEQQEKLQSLTPKTQRQLEQSGIPLDEYASFLLSREKIGEDRQDAEKMETFF